MLEVDRAGWVAVAALVGVGAGEASDGRFGARPAGDLDAERRVVAADVGAGESSRARLREAIESVALPSTTSLASV